MTAPPIVLVPGFWLGAWAWDEVAAALRADGHDVTALTLPGLESADADRSSITLADHVDAICDAVRAAGTPGRARRAQRRRARPATPSATASPSGSRRWSTSTPARRRARSTPTSTGDELPLPVARGARGGGEPRRAQRGAARDVPAAGRSRAGRARCARRPSSRTTRGSTCRARSICTGFTSEQYKDAVKEGYAWLGGFAELRDVTWVDLPTSHWPMWSRPRELAAIIGDVARAAVTPEASA